MFANASWLLVEARSFQNAFHDQDDMVRIIIKIIFCVGDSFPGANDDDDYGGDGGDGGDHDHDHVITWVRSLRIMME